MRETVECIVEPDQDWEESKMVEGDAVDNNSR